MKEYRCTVEKCPGIVRFPDPQRHTPKPESSAPESSKPNKAPPDDLGFVILDEPLAQCNVCKKGYFESELA
jgi:hypothetical protein